MMKNSYPWPKLKPCKRGFRKGELAFIGASPINWDFKTLTLPKFGKAAYLFWEHL